MKESQSIRVVMPRSRIADFFAVCFFVGVVGVAAVAIVISVADTPKARAIRNAVGFALSGQATPGQMLDEAGHQFGRALPNLPR